MARVRILLLALMMQLQPFPASAPAAPGEALRVSIITLGPGIDVYEKFGHNMLRIQDQQSGYDKVFNWGVFAFSDDFIPNFIQGRLIYWMESWDTAATMDAYIAEDRTIWEQELDLSPAQRQALLDFCQWNEQADNRFYRYDYYGDNCSTRLRDAVDLVLNGQIKAQATTMPSDETFRSETLRLMAGSPHVYTALDFVLGKPVDRPISGWDEMFIPMRMRERLNQVMITDGSGRPIPLVKQELIRNTGSRPPLRQTAPNRVGWYALIGLLIGGTIGWTGAHARSGRRIVRWGFGAGAVLWALLNGVAGCLLAYLWFGTDHVVVGSNENILQLSPILLPMVVLAPLALRGRRRVLKAGMIVACGAMGISALGLVLKVLPWMNQANWNIIALALPANAGLAWAMWKLSVKGSST